VTLGKELVSLIVWTCTFLAFELPAHFIARCPWFTLSSTVWHGESWWAPVGLVVAVFTAVLLGHLELHWSVRYLLIVAAAAVALIASHALHRVT
jgi:hypothetical protein